MNIALIGFRGTGKTTIAKILAKNLDRKIISTDEEIEKKTKMKISAFVKKHGWDKFRDIESEITEHICDFDDCIFDTGGGIIMRNENITNLKKTSLIILLTADLKTITARLRGSKDRPAIKKSKFLDEIGEVMQEREEKYTKAADYAIDTSRLSPEETSKLIEHYYQTELN